MPTKWTEKDVETIFSMSGHGSDFCIDRQDDKIVFGGWNRLFLYPDGTLKGSASHCHPTFKEFCDRLGIDFV